MKQTQLGTWLQNKVVLAVLLMVLVAGTAAAGVIALRDKDSQEQENTDPGYAAQTQADDVLQNQQLEQQGTGLPSSDLSQGWLEQPEELQELNSLLQNGDIHKENKPGTVSPQENREDQGDRPAQSDRVEAVSGDNDVSGELLQDDPMTGIAPGEAEAETLVSGDEAVVYEPESQAEEADAPGVVLDFQADSTMGWPVFGNVVLDYSMDTTVYFPTLKQYKCNPGILIQAEVGQPVAAATRGQVTAIGVDEEWGNFIMMDLGGDYTLCYGQLDEIQVAIGQTVEAGETLGVVALPTKYYVVEGPNLYM